MKSSFVSSKAKRTPHSASDQMEDKNGQKRPRPHDKSSTTEKAKAPPVVVMASVLAELSDEDAMARYLDRFRIIGANHYASIIFALIQMVRVDGGDIHDDDERKEEDQYEDADPTPAFDK